MHVLFNTCHFVRSIVCGRRSFWFELGFVRIVQYLLHLCVDVHDCWSCNDRIIRWILRIRKLECVCEERIILIRLCRIWSRLTQLTKWINQLAGFVRFIDPIGCGAVSLIVTMGSTELEVTVST
jgi:hypothetical protein